MRAQSAQATRKRLADSARRLFVTRGYAATSIDLIAADAGSAVQTFYATYGSKRAVLLALLDQVDQAADVGRLIEGLQESRGQPMAQLRKLVDFNARLYSGAADLLDIIRSAGHADPDIAALWREGEGRRRAGQAPVVKQWAAAGALRAGLGERAAADLVWSLLSPDLYRLLVVESGWSLPKYRSWLVASLPDLLFHRAVREVE